MLLYLIASFKHLHVKNIHWSVLLNQEMHSIVWNNGEFFLCRCTVHCWHLCKLWLWLVIGKYFRTTDKWSVEDCTGTASNWIRFVSMLCCYWRLCSLNTTKFTMWMVTIRQCHSLYLLLQSASVTDMAMNLWHGTSSRIAITPKLLQCIRLSHLTDVETTFLVLPATIVDAQAWCHRRL